MTANTDALIAQLTELAAKASPGPWLYHHDSLYENGAASISWRPHGSSAALIVLLKEAALPILKTLAAENAELRALGQQLTTQLQKANVDKLDWHEHFQAASAELAPTRTRLSEAMALLEGCLSEMQMENKGGHKQGLLSMQIGVEDWLARQKEAAQ